MNNLIALQRAGSSGAPGVLASSHSLPRALEDEVVAIPLIMGVDQGTQSTRVFLFDKNMQAQAVHQLPINQIYPKPGWCEHDPLQLWSTVQECIVKALEEATTKLGKISVKAVGITNQRETTVVWHKHTGQPLHNAIVWMDTRTRDICAAMEKELGGKVECGSGSGDGQGSRSEQTEFFRPVTGLPISTYFSAFKFKWMYENSDDVRDAVDAGVALFGTVDSWLIYQLTGGCSLGGVHVTDVTNASRTMLMDVNTCAWHEPYLTLFNIPESALPRIVSNAEVYGNVAEGALEGVPISGCLGDQMAALLGQRCVSGEAKNTYGTGCFMLLNTGPAVISSSHGLLTTLSYKLGPEAPAQYALEGAVAVAGMGVSWMHDNLCMVEGPEDLEALAKSVPDTGGVYFVPAFSGLLAPYWNEKARGTILGLTGFTTRAHIARALLEAICFQTREVLDSMRKDASLAGLRLLRVDGGASRNDLLMQLQADLLQVLVKRPHFQETTALGAALAAGLGVGFWEEEQVFAGHAYHNAEFEPSVPLEDSERRYAHWLKAVQRSMDLADLAE